MQPQGKQPKRVEQPTRPRRLWSLPTARKAHGSFDDIEGIVPTLERADRFTRREVASDAVS